MFASLKLHLFVFLEFAIIIRDLVGVSSDITQMDAVIDDPQRRKPDITRAKQVLNWQPRINLKEGLKRTIEYFRAELEQEKQAAEINLPHDIL